MKRPIRKAKNGDETPVQKARRVVREQQKKVDQQKDDQRRIKSIGTKPPVTAIKNGKVITLAPSSIDEAFKKGGIMKTKMKTGGMVNPNKKATVTTKATKYTGGKNGTMMKGKGTKKK